MKVILNVANYSTVVDGLHNAMAFVMHNFVTLSCFQIACVFPAGRFLIAHPPIMLIWQLLGEKS